MTFEELDRMLGDIILISFIPTIIFLIWLRTKHSRIFFEGRLNPFADQNKARREHDERFHKSMSDFLNSVKDGTFKPQYRTPTPEERIEAKLDKLIKLLEEE